jgi:hypothetical protein
LITLEDLDAAIAECQGERNPNANTCIKLAAYYTIRDNMAQKTEPSDFGASYAPAPVIDAAERYIDYHTDTELSKLIDGKESYPVWEVMDELMQTLRLVFPQMYSSTVQKIKLKTQ